jgi:hypothetical protein
MREPGWLKLPPTPERWIQERLGFLPQSLTEKELFWNIELRSLTVSFRDCRLDPAIQGLLGLRLLDPRIKPEGDRKEE